MTNPLTQGDVAILHGRRYGPLLFLDPAQTSTLPRLSERAEVILHATPFTRILGLSQASKSTPTAAHSS